jgi:hypothetical protein
MKKVFSGCLRAIWSPQRPIFASLRYQLIARATYLPKGYLTKPRFRLRSDSQTRLSGRSRRLIREFKSRVKRDRSESGDASSHRLKKMHGEDYARHQLIARATCLPKGHLTKPRLRLRLRYQLIARATYLADSVALTRNTGWVASKTG